MKLRVTLDFGTFEIEPQMKRDASDYHDFARQIIKDGVQIRNKDGSFTYYPVHRIQCVHIKEEE